MFCLLEFKFFQSMNPLNAAFLALVFFAASASAAYWQSEDFDCSIDLPDGQSTNSQTNWTTLVRPKKELWWAPDATIGPLSSFSVTSICPNEKTFISTKNRSKNWKLASSVRGKVFAEALERISLHGMPGYRLTGDSVYHGAHYGLVVDMFEANSRIYEIAGMKEDDAQPLKDPDIKERHVEFQIALAVKGVRRSVFGVHRSTVRVRRSSEPWAFQVRLAVTIVRLY